MFAVSKTRAPFLWLGNDEKQNATFFVDSVFLRKIDVFCFRKNILHSGLRLCLAVVQVLRLDMQRLSETMRKC